MLAGIKPGTQATKLRQEADAAYALAAITEGDYHDALIEDAQRSDKQAGLAESYRYMQLLAGIVAVGFPVVLVVGHLLIRGFDENTRAVEPSLSHYYYTRLGNFFVGALCALGLFFLSYQRKPLPGFQWDNRITTFAGFMAFGVAMLPTAFDSHGLEGSERIVFYAHLGSAMLLFVALGVLAWARFTLSDRKPSKLPWWQPVLRVVLFWKTDAYDASLEPQQKRARNTIYRWCARVIFLMLLLLGVNVPTTFLEGLPVVGDYYLLIAEVCCVWAFGFAWLVKAEVFPRLNDPS